METCSSLDGSDLDANNDPSQPHASRPRSAQSTQDATLVRGARATVLLVLFLSAVTVASLAYFLLSLSENESFKAQVCSHESVCLP
jgi:hypothetical protein